MSKYLCVTLSGIMGKINKIHTSTPSADEHHAETILASPTVCAFLNNETLKSSKANPNQTTQQSH